MLGGPSSFTLFPYTTLFRSAGAPRWRRSETSRPRRARSWCPPAPRRWWAPRSEEHTSELQSHSDLVCRLLLEKKKTDQQHVADMYVDGTARSNGCHDAPLYR